MILFETSKQKVTHKLFFFLFNIFSLLAYTKTIVQALGELDLESFIIIII